MNTHRKITYYRLLRICKRFINVETKEQLKIDWIKPSGSETDIKLYNPIAKCKVPLILKNENYLTWYMCGPTVYDSAHIGHATTYVRSDIIRRILNDYFNINTLLVMGVTNIDDKIIRRSATKAVDFQELAAHYENEFFEEMQMLNILKPHLSCRVSDYIPEIIEFVNNILIKKKGYIGKDGSVYFDTCAYDKYGKLLNPKTDMEHADKKSTLDFALWKLAKDNEPSWESPWGHGRPGWHIECSAMASAIFGNSIDIHSGGVDLIFPHHENEEAQSCCYHEVHQWVNYWLHFGHLYIKPDVKMSKSLNNSISIREFLKTYTSNQFRVLCLLTHYRSDLDYSDKLMHMAASTLDKIENFLLDCDKYITGTHRGGNVDEVALLSCLNKTKSVIHTALANDFNTSQAIHAILKLITVGNKMLSSNGDTVKGNGITAIVATSNYISGLLSKLGITQSQTTENRRVETIIEQYVSFRTVVRKKALTTKDSDLLAACDEARINLSTCGVVMKDSKDTTSWSIRKF